MPGPMLELQELPAFIAGGGRRTLPTPYLRCRGPRPHIRQCAGSVRDALDRPACGPRPTAAVDGPGALDACALSHPGTLRNIWPGRVFAGVV